jgi:hypothetical protein
MPKYLILYKVNSSQQPTDPQLALQFFDMNVAAIEGLKKAGIIKDIGTLAPGEGYLIVEYSSFEEAVKAFNPFFPAISMEIREVLSWEQTVDVVKADLETKIEMMRK